MATQGIVSTVYESWVTNLKAVQGLVRKRIFGAFASVLGDKTIAWMTQANLEHLPAFASDQGVALIASERQLDTAAAEAVSDIAARAPYWLQLARFSGSQLGILLGLHFAGFNRSGAPAIIVQQNGWAYQLTFPLPPFVLGQAWDPTPNLVKTACSTLSVPLTSNVTPPTTTQVGRSIPTGTNWWGFAESRSVNTNVSDTDMCSRFAVLFPGATSFNTDDSLPTAFVTTGVATFTGLEDGSPAKPWPTATWNNPFVDTTYKIQTDGVTVTDGGGPVAAVADLRTKSPTGVQVMPSAPFVGHVDVLAWQAGANPYADLHPADLARLQGVIAKWRASKASCVGVYAVAQGQMFAWPIQIQGANSVGPASIVRFEGA